MLPAFAKQVWQMYMAEAIGKGVPQALRACYVNDRIHYRMLFIFGVDKYDEHVLRNLFPITTHECIRRHKLKARASFLAMEDNSTWTTMNPLKDYDVEMLCHSRMAKLLYDQNALSVYEKEPVRDLSIKVFIHLTSQSQVDYSDDSEGED
jgi:hypothetical protein